MPAAPVTPLTVLTGFLGSGKTTLANRLLRDPRFADTAVLVNEWGEVPIDHALVRAASENVVVLAGGCVCCRVAGDLVRALRELHFQRVEGAIPAFGRALVETTGLADPAPLLATLVEMPLVAARYSLAGVVTVVDAQHGARTWIGTRVGEEAAMADRDGAFEVRPRAEDASRARGAAARPIRRPRSSIGREAPDLRCSRDRAASRRRRLADAQGWLNAGAYRRLGAAGRRHDPISRPSSGAPRNRAPGKTSKLPSPRCSSCAATASCG